MRGQACCSSLDDKFEKVCDRPALVSSGCGVWPTSLPPARTRGKVLLLREATLRNSHSRAANSAARVPSSHGGSHWFESSAAHFPGDLPVNLTSHSAAAGWLFLLPRWLGARLERGIPPGRSDFASRLRCFCAAEAVDRQAISSTQRARVAETGRRFKPVRRRGGWASARSGGRAVAPG